MNTGRDNELNVLKLTLHDRLIGYLSGFVNGRNVLPSFRTCLKHYQSLDSDRLL